MEETMIKALGFEYRRLEKERTFEVEVPERKKEEFAELVEKIKADMSRSKVDLKDMERVAGKATFITSLGVLPRQWAIRALSHWAVQANFYWAVNAGRQATIRLALDQASEVIKRLEPVRMSTSNLTVKVVKSVTDAACPEDPSLGGFTIGSTGKGKAWTIDWKKEVGEVNFWEPLVHRKSHIGIWELFSVLINLILNSEEIVNSKLYLFIDNSGDVRIVQKGTSNCIVS